MKPWNSGSRQPNHPLCQDYKNIACCLFSAVSFCDLFKLPLIQKKLSSWHEIETIPDISGNGAWDSVFVPGVFLMSGQILKVASNLLDFRDFPSKIMDKGITKRWGESISMMYISLRVQLIPYFRFSLERSLNLAPSLYLYCETIYPELPYLPKRLRSLQMLYIIEVASGTRIF